MSTDHARLRKLFVAACDLTPEQQIGLLDQNCSDDPELRSMLEKLLRKDGSTDGILADAGLTGELQYQFETIADYDPPAQVGRYRIKRLLGEGGMGAVYLAQQQNPLRDVAVKVIRSGFTSRELRQRFEREAAILGRLQHPGIARIYEAGLFDDGSAGPGRPFFAMEYIEGCLLGEFVQKKKPDKRKRLMMFIQICDAVHHAHQQGVIHRDLKPGNILVTDDGQTHILDFGVARATESDRQVSTLQTHAGQMIGTLPYMSPEQMLGTGDQIDMRSDVFSLGVIVYEMLSGKLPCEIQGRAFLDAVRTLSDARPVPLATVDREFRGDLNTIVLKALERDPDRRYPSAAALAEDIQRYLEDQPVLARPATQWYQFTRFVKRNRPLVAGIAGSILLLVGGIIGTTIGMLQARDQASRQLAINEFMSEFLVSPDPNLGNANVKMVDVLRDAAGKVSLKFQDHPQLEAEVCHLLGSAFKNLSLYDDSVALSRRAYQLRQQEFGLSHQLTRSTGSLFAFSLLTRNASECIAIANEVLQQTPRHEINGENALDVRRFAAVAKTRLGEYDEAEQELRELIRLTHTLFGPESRVNIFACQDLAGLLTKRAHFGKSLEPENDYRESIAIGRDVVSRCARLEGVDGLTTLKFMMLLGTTLRYSGNWEESEAVWNQLLELAPPRLGADHYICTAAMSNLARVRMAQGQYGEAAEYAIKGISLIRQRTGNDDVEVMAAMGDALPMVEAGNRFVEGEEYARILLEKIGSGHASVAVKHQLYLARFLSGQGKFEEADVFFEKTRGSDSLQSNNIRACEYNYFLGEHCLAKGDAERAMVLFNEALQLSRNNTENLGLHAARIEDAVDRAFATTGNQQ